ncbi:hypothetical protein [Demequina rhizosphaerae]|uniref:hypothetical protein n=1 Tax=Demequina rhizosphaerae TaxID=1638985 RepID=UPI0007840A1F|nr:hypothetical protein [Demequina rhizosphaerae]
MSGVARLSLVVAYAVLALAALGRSTYQIATKLSDAPVPYLVSGVSALLYLVIAVALWRRWTGVALVGTALELLGVLVVGTLGYVESSWWPDETVWTGYGSAYGWVPLLLPAIALALLLRERRARRDDAGVTPAQEGAA